MPLWIWNGEVSEARITEMLEQFAVQGMGGVFVHPRTGLVTEYLSERWFALWAYALDECRRLGLGCHIYDENSFPSGFAGGHVVARNPHAVGRFFTLVPVAGREAALEQGGRFFHPGTGEPATVGEVRAGPADAVWLCARAVAPEPRLWHGGFPYVDLTRPGAAAEFIATTHAAYAARFGGECGRTIRYAFTDEPTLEDEGPSASPHFLAAFRAEHGYGLEERLDAFLADGAGAFAVRHDYQATRLRLWTENFLRPMHDWCGAHGLEFTGHFNEHHWPDANGNPCCMWSQRWMQAPGVDLLGFQFTARDRAANGLYLLTLREVASVARQLDRRRVLCETAGGGGYGMGPGGMKRLVDWAIAQGITLVNPHLSHQTLAGVRKYDWPQTMSDHASWWACYRPQADHEARLVAALLEGRPAGEILVLQPTTAAWLRSLPSGWQAGPAAGASRAWLERCRARQVGLVAALADRLLEFDLGNEHILADQGMVDGDRLRVGAATYSVVVVPEMMDHWLDSTVALLEAFLAAGGTVLALCPPPPLVRGRPDPRPAALAARHPDRWRQVAGVGALVEELARRTPPPLAAPDGGPAPAGLEHRRVVLPDGASLHFLANPWDTPLEAAVRLAGRGILELDTRDGSARPRAARPEGGHVVAALHLPPGGHALWLAEAAPRPVAPEPAWTAGATTPAGIVPGGDNVLTLDYCDWQVPALGIEARGLATIRADARNWQAHGFEKNRWNFSIQYRRTFVEAPVPVPAGFAVEYAFAVASADPPRGEVRLAVERPWIYRVSLNGAPVDFTAAARWWDENVRAAAVTALLRPGENRVRLVAERFEPLMEIAPAYLVGEFALAAAERGFEVGAVRPLQPGWWHEQGWPFYAGTMRYRFELSLPAPAARWRVAAPGWRGLALRVWLDGTEAGLLFEAEGRLAATSPLAAGPHRLELEVFGNLKNQLGPHFNDGLPGPWSWDQHPEQAPGGSAYRFSATGLPGRPRFEWAAV